MIGAGWVMGQRLIRHDSIHSGSEDIWGTLEG
jgi:hypothetical protein